MSRAETLLHIENFSLSLGHPGERATVVEDVTFSVGKGQKVALVGESGSGKSVTAMSVLRLHDPGQSEYGGRILFEGTDVLGLPERRLRGMRGRDVAMIFQEPMTSLNPVYPIGEQLTEPLILHEGVERSRARLRAVELLDRVGISEPHKRLDAFPHMLSGGQRQRVMIAMALACRPKLLIADEPTTALDVTIQKQILELLNELQREYGMAVLLITHDLRMVRHFAERVCVMQQGKLVEQNSVSSLFSSPQHPYTRKLLESEPEPLVGSEIGSFDSAEPLLSADNIVCHFPIKSGFFRRTVGKVKAVDKVTLGLRPGETLGIVGESGSGKSTLGRCLLRLQGCEGRIRFDQRQIDSLDMRQMRPLRRDMQMVFQDPFSSLSPRMPVEQIISEGLSLHFPKLSAGQRRERVAAVLREVGLEEQMMERYPHEFSGGQRQRIAIARAVVLEPKVILLDEPTSALDVSVQKQVLKLLRELQLRHHMSYLFISHDLKVIAAMAHKVMVMRDGKVVEYGATSRIFNHPREEYTRALLDASLLDELDAKDRRTQPQKSDTLTES